MEWLAALNAAFARDPAIDEIGFIVDDLEHGEAARRSPSERVVLVDHKLGVPFAALAPVSLAAMSCLRSAEQADDVLTASRAILIVNADQSAAWHARKRWLVLRERTAACFDSELQFVALLLTKHPKSGDAWAHRHWLVRERQTRFGVRHSAPWLAHEAALCSRVGDVYPRCYYAWSYRLALFMAAIDAEAASLSAQLAIVAAELHRLGDFVRRHVSDGSAYNLRRALLLRVVRECGASLLSQALLRVEWALTRHIIDYYPGHASVWHHRRAIAALWHSLWPLADDDTGAGAAAVDVLVADAIFGRADRRAAAAASAAVDLHGAALTAMPHDAAQSVVLACQLGELCGEPAAAEPPALADVSHARPLTLGGELSFAARHAQDRFVERYTSQREGALGYAVFLLLLTKRAAVASAEWRHAALRRAGFEDATIQNVDAKNGDLFVGNARPQAFSRDQAK